MYCINCTVLFTALVTVLRTVLYTVLNTVSACKSTGDDAVLVDDFLSFDPNKPFKFFPLIHSTAIAVAPLDSELKAVKAEAKFSKFDFDLKDCYSSNGVPVCLCLIPLHPKRRDLKLSI